MAGSVSGGPAVWPTTRCKDTRALIDFLVAAFGGVMLGDAQGGDADHVALPSGPISVYVATDEPDAIHDRAVAAGATIVRGLRDEEYGSRGFSASDPEGNVWSFGTYAGD